MGKILITGVAGLLGSRLADWIIENTNFDVIGVDDLSGGYAENINKKVNFYNFNLTNLEKLKEVFKKENIEIVYHFAAYAAEGLSPFIRKFNYENNVIASSNLITSSIEFNIKRFVFASSMAVYGDKYEPPFHEDLLQSPIDPYGVAKYAIEMDLKIASNQHGLNYTIVRPHNFYGINQNIWDKYRNVIGIWMYQILNKKNPTIFGDGSQVRAFNNNCIGEIINLGGTKEYSIGDACDILINVTGQNIKPVHLEPRHESKYAWATWDKSIELLDFQHKIELEEGIAKMWEWAKKQPVRKRFVWPKYELNKGIYEYWKS